VQGESKGKGNDEVFHFPLPNRSLFYQKIVQGESKGKGNDEVFHFPLPIRSLFYQKIVQGEYRRKSVFQKLPFPLPRGSLFRQNTTICAATSPRGGHKKVFFTENHQKLMRTYCQEMKKLYFCTPIIIRRVRKRTRQAGS